MVPHRVTHVIFDLDGLILDSEAIYEEIMTAMARSHGKEYTPEVKLKILGTPEHESARIFVKELDLPITVEQCLDEYYKKIAEELTNPPFMPGAKKLIKHLANHNVPIAIATSSGRAPYDIKTQSHPEIFNLFLHVVCGTDNPEIKHGKPAPDIFLNCASKFPDNPDPQKVLVFEDSPNGARAGMAAGMQTVFVPDKDVNEEIKKIATLSLNSLDDFKPEMFGLPPFED
ncbi:pseudouridine-5'-phosphatase-like [Euwallacea fornicatus]|uniref:pseudouridine-5'-phosphatase-like n=1 Tax=Euwallacea fornicatus TaxID=995702 RepID=UPI00338FB87D